MHRLIGKGAFGQVFETSIFGDSSTTRYAIKVVDKLMLSSPEMLRRIRNEVNIHSSLNHSNILTLHHNFEDNRAVYLVMELCSEGELYQLLKRQPNGRLSEAEARPLFIDVCKGLQYLHRQLLIHRDLKLSNILLARDVQNKRIAKIGDFGLACRVRNMDINFKPSNGEQLTICGTPNYLAPEVVQKRPYGQEADLWSLGCLLYTMLVGKAPFEGKDLRATFAKVSAAQYELPEFLSVGVRDLLNGLMKVDPLQRNTLEQIMEHPFFLSSVPLFVPVAYPIINPNVISTRRLRPVKQTIKHGTIEIDTQSRVIFTVDSDRSVMKVSGDGQSITFTDATGRSESCRFSELGRAARKRYEYMRRFVDLVRSKTPMIVLKTDRFKIVVMEEEVILTIPEDGQISLRCGTDTVTAAIFNVRYEFFHPTYRSVERIEDPTVRRWMLEFLSRLEQLKRVMSSLHSDSPEFVFPFVIDETTNHSAINRPSHITTSIKSFESGQLSGISMLKTPFLQSISPRFVQNVGWCIDGMDDTAMLLSNDGMCLPVNIRSRQVCINDRWQDIDHRLSDRVKFTLQAFSLFK